MYVTKRHALKITKGPFHEDGAESEEGSSAPPKAKTKALKAKKAELEGIHSHEQKTIHTSITSRKAQDTAAP